MRWAATVALVAALAACEGDRPRTAPTPTPTATGERTGAGTARGEDTAAAQEVRAAFAATREKRTARFVAECRTAWDGGSFRMRREGVYDARAARAAVTQTTRLDGTGPVRHRFEWLVKPGRELAHAVIDGDEGYIRLPSWPASIRERWMPYTDTSNVVGVSVDVMAFPESLAMLQGARRGTRDGDTYEVDVTPFWANLGMPTDCTPTAFSGKEGVSVLRVPFDVRAEVEVRDGLVTKVSYDLIEVFRHGWPTAKVDPDVETVTSVAMTLTLSDHGLAAEIDVPRGREVVSRDEFHAVT